MINQRMLTHYLFKYIRKEDYLCALIALLSILIYLASSFFTYKIGFPLDDSWIHQTYSRNLAYNGEWAFISGQPSAGSTSPLWTFILAVGYYLNLNYLFWAYLIGWICLTFISIIGMRIINNLYPDEKKWIILSGSFFVLEWHLVWAAVSGMETLLFSSVALGVCYCLLGRQKNPIFVGVLIGISIWLRPDGLTLLGPVLCADIIRYCQGDRRVPRFVYTLLGFFLLFLPYLLFNYTVDGALWPNTFYAKQAEYAVELHEPWWKRIGEQLLLPLVGGGFLLLPGFIYQLYYFARSKNLEGILSIIWLVGFLVVYAYRLPVIYQHGRYAMPVMPLFFTIGLAGLLRIICTGYNSKTLRILISSWMISTYVILASFYVIGARAYSRDVAFIETEMVSTALWISQNTSSADMVAAHDIGALGYFGGRKIIDLAGLVSPEVIPIIRNEEELSEFISERKANYLVAFPGWYPQLVNQAVPVFSTHGIFAPLMGGENMVIYRWLTVP